LAGGARAIPILTLAGAILLLTALDQRLPAPDGLGPEAGRRPVIEAVRTAPADPFRYGGRTVGEILDRTEPAPGWTDLGWVVEAGPDATYRATLRFGGPNGAERAYRFTVDREKDTVHPANKRAGELMNSSRNPRKAPAGAAG